MQCVGFSLEWLLLLQSSVSGRAGFRSWGSWTRERRRVGVAHGLSRPAACGAFPDQGLNPGPLHWQMDSFITEPPAKSPRQHSYFVAKAIEHKGSSERNRSSAGSDRFFPVRRVSQTGPQTPVRTPLSLTSTSAYQGWSAPPSQGCREDYMSLSHKSRGTLWPRVRALRLCYYH